jgi:hypothetical protein
MSSAKESFGDRFYRGLLRILPFDFRSEFGDDMEETFREQRAARSTPGRMVSFMWWTRYGYRPWRRASTSACWRTTRAALRMMGKNRGYTLARSSFWGSASAPTRPSSPW